MRTFSLLLLLFGATTGTELIVTNPAQASTNPAFSVTMLNAQTEQANDVNPNRGGGRRHLVDDARLEQSVKSRR